MVDMEVKSEAFDMMQNRHETMEIASTFGFQGSRWLADVAPQLLSDDVRADVRRAKEKAVQRVALEKLITKEMLYVKGWPTRMLTDIEAAALATVRRGVSELIGLRSHYLDVPSIHGRYAELMAEKVAA